MTTINHTGVSHTVFHLLGILGLEDQHMWISIPFFTSYVIAPLGNSLLIFIILTKGSLREPMYLFLCMLAGTDIVLSPCTVPQALSFWFHAGAISLNCCITQLFVIHSTFISESGILLLMAFDLYIAVCYPLRYTTILTQALIRKICVIIILRSYCTVFPIFILKRLTFCQNNIIPIPFVNTLVWPGIFTTLTLWFGHHIPPHIHILLANVYFVAPPMPYPIIYGIQTKQIREQVAHMFPKQK